MAIGHAIYGTSSTGRSWILSLFCKVFISLEQTKASTSSLTFCLMVLIIRQDLVHDSKISGVSSQNNRCTSCDNNTSYIFRIYRITRIVEVYQQSIYINKKNIYYVLKCCNKTKTPFGIAVQTMFCQNSIFFFIKIEFGLYFLDCFDVLMLKMIFKK